MAHQDFDLGGITVTTTAEVVEEVATAAEMAALVAQGGNDYRVRINDQDVTTPNPFLPAVAPVVQGLQARGQVHLQALKQRVLQPVARAGVHLHVAMTRFKKRKVRAGLALREKKRRANMVLLGAMDRCKRKKDRFLARHRQEADDLDQPLVPRHRSHSYDGGLNLAVPFMGFEGRDDPATPTDLLRGVGDVINRKVLGPLRRITELVEQSPLVPDLTGHLTAARTNDIINWAFNTLSDTESPSDKQDPHDFVALTTRELLGLKGARIDTIEVVNPHSDPSNSPEIRPTEGAGSIPDFDVLDSNEDINDADNETLYEKTRINYKDLMKHLGHARVRSFHVIANNSTVYDANANLSDWYGIQLVEPRRNKKVQLGPDYKDPIVKHSRSTNDRDDTAVERAEAQSLILDDNSMILDLDQNHAVAAPSYRPAVNLILFLSGKGMSHGDIAKFLVDVDEEFLKSHINMVRGVFFPQQLDWSDEQVANVRKEFTQKQHPWATYIKEAWKDRHYGSSRRLEKEKERSVKLDEMLEFVQYTIEKHFFLRFAPDEDIEQVLMYDSDDDSDDEDDYEDDGEEIIHE